MHPVAAAFAGVLLLCTLPHCSGRFADLCEKEKDCQGGNDADVDACIERSRGAEEVASAYDCSEPFEKYADCLEEKSTCGDNNGRKSFSSGGACNAAEEAFESCQQAASAKGK